jgi:SCO1/SenC
MGDDKWIKAVFITVDPERDTPAVMKEYLSSFDPNIIGLSGTREETAARFAPCLRPCRRCLQFPASCRRKSFRPFRWTLKAMVAFAN